MDRDPATRDDPVLGAAIATLVVAVFVVVVWTMGPTSGIGPAPQVSTTADPLRTDETGSVRRDPGRPGTAAP